MTHFAELTSPQVAALHTDSRVPVLLLPVGAVEPHGPHAPLGTDQIISTGMCERATARLAGDTAVRPLILPPIPYGVTRYATAFPGVLHIEPRTLRCLVLDVCQALTEQGLRRVVIVNNHFEPEHLSTLREAASAAQQDQGCTVAHLDLVRRRNAARLTAEFRSGQCHAGQYETSLVLAERAELVDSERMRDLKPVPVDMPAAMADGKADFLAMGMDGAYCGTPAQASAQEGERTFDTLTAMLIETVREIATTAVRAT